MGVSGVGRIDVSMVENELKFELPEGAVHAVAASLRRLGARNAAIESRHVDADDGRLAAAGVSLRLRKRAGRWEQTVKAPGPSAFERLEETVARPGRWGPEGPEVDPALHAGTRAGRVLADALRGEGGGTAALVPVSTTRVRRSSVVLDVGDARVELAFDRGTIVAGDRVEAICEVEYELVSGDPAALVTLARAAVVAHGMWLSTLSKGARGVALARRAGRIEPTHARRPVLRKTMSAPTLRREIVAACLEQVCANASVLARGQSDDEVIHQLRIGLRRLRTAARELAAEDASPAPWEGAVTDVFRALGDCRDRTIVAITLGRALADAGSPEPRLAPSSAASPDPVALVRAAAFQLALIDVVADVIVVPRSDARSAATPETTAPTSAPEQAHEARAAIATRLSKLHAALGKAARRFGAVDDAERHRVRKRLKRLRYLAEMVGPLYGSGAVDRYLVKLRPAQDALGAYVDLIVGLELAAASVSAGDSGAWFNVGWLKAQLPRAAKRCRKALADAATAKPFWRR